MADRGDGATSDLTRKQEAFVVAYLETGNAAEAYRRAYDVDESARDSWLYVEACQMLDNPKIARRLAEVQEQAVQLAIYTRQSAMEELEAARSLAMGEAQAAAAVSAINAKIKLFGMDRPKRLEISGPGGKPIESEEVTARDRITRRLASLAAAGSAKGDTDGSE